MQQPGSEPALGDCGYPCGMFLTPPPRKLKCGICMEVLNDPVQVCSGHHTYCRACIAIWRATKSTCPECRVSIRGEEPARFIKETIEELEVRCPYAGCGGGSNSIDSGSGSGSGQTNSASSSSNSSNTVDTRAGRQQKKRKQDHGAVPSSVPSSEPAATSCEWTGQLREYGAHLAVCPFVEVSCPFAEAGCAFRAARRDMGAHSGDTAAHFLMLMTTVAAGKAKTAAVEAKIAVVEAESAAKITAVEAVNQTMNGTMASLQEDSRLLKVCVSILHAAGDEEAAGDMEWVSKRTFHTASGPYIYTGQMRGGERHGFGGASWATGMYISYDGQWQRGTRHGQGVYKWRDGSVYEGEWKQGEKHGQGIYKWRDGSSHVGQWLDGKQHGQGVYKLANGDSEEGRWVKEKRQGKFIFTKVDGTRYNRVFKDDIQKSQTPIP